MAGWSKYFFLIWMCCAFLLPARILFAQISALEFHGSSILKFFSVDDISFFQADNFTIMTKLDVIIFGKRRVTASVA